MIFVLQNYLCRIRMFVTTNNNKPIRVTKMAKNALLHYNRERSDIDLAVVP